MYSQLIICIIHIIFTNITDNKQSVTNIHMGNTTHKSQYNKQNKSSIHRTSQLLDIASQVQTNPNNNYYKNQTFSSSDSYNKKQPSSPINICCGMQISNNKKKNTKNKLTWQQNVMIYCQKYKNKLQWVQDIMKIVKSKDSNMQKYKKQFNDIRYMQKQPTNMQKTVILTSTQLSKFKLNLRKSVLLHPKQVCQPFKQINKIQTSIQPNSNMRKSQNLRSELYLSQFNSPYASTTFHRNTNHSNFRQSLKKQSVATFMRPKINIRQSVISLVDDTMTSMFKGQQQQICKLNQYSLQIFIKFTIMLQKHLTSEDNKIAQIIKAFYQNLQKKYSTTNHYYNFHQNNNTNNMQNKNKNYKLNKSDISSQIQSQLNVLDLENIIQNIKIFIALLTQIVQDYYNTKSLTSNTSTNDVYSSFSTSQAPTSKTSQSFTSSYQSNSNPANSANHLITNYQNILTIVTAIIFKDQKFYNFIFSIIKQFNKQKDEHADLLFSKLHTKSPQYFSINQQYCLNFATLKKHMDEKSSVQSNVYIQNLVPQDLQSNQQQPYRICSQSLLKISKSRTPISKMKAILQCAQKITQSIIQFYNTNRMELKNQMLDADQVLSIFCYILTINKIDNIFSHLFMIQHFATQHQKISMTGYYYSVISCAVQQNFGQNSTRHEQLQIQIQQQKDRKYKKQQYSSKQQKLNSKNQSLVDRMKKQKYSIENINIIEQSPVQQQNKQDNQNQIKGMISNQQQ